MQAVLDLGIEHQRKLALNQLLAKRPGLPPPAVSFWRRLPVYSPFQATLLWWNSTFAELCDIPNLREGMTAGEIFLRPEEARFISKDTETAHIASMQLLCAIAAGFHHDAASRGEGIIVHISRVGRVRRCFMDMAAIYLCGQLKEMLLVEWPLPDSTEPYIVTGGFIKMPNPNDEESTWHFLQVDPDTHQKPLTKLSSLPLSDLHWRCDFCSVRVTPLRRCDFLIYSSRIALFLRMVFLRGLIVLLR